MCKKWKKYTFSSMYPAPALGALLSEIDKARKTMKGKWKTHLKWLLKQKA
jgi:hypothetical protein